MHKLVGLTENKVTSVHQIKMELGILSFKKQQIHEIVLQPEVESIAYNVF
jgi:hypothetical protein